MRRSEVTALEFLSQSEAPLLQFLERLIETPSPNPPGNEVAVADLVREYLESFGISQVALHSRVAERPNVIATIDGDHDGPGLLFCGHLDTKPTGDLTSWEGDPYKARIRDGRMFGLGAADMKGGVAAMVFAAAAVQREVGDLHGRLVLAFTADEEAGGHFGAEYLASHGLVRADAGVVVEPAGATSDWEYLYSSSRGESCFTVRVRGTPMHSSISDLVPATSATIKAAELLLRMRDSLSFAIAGDNEPRVTFTPAVMARGGETFGMLPAVAEFTCEVRMPPGLDQEHIRLRLEDFLAAERLRDSQLDVEWQFAPPPMDWIAPHAMPDGDALVQSLASAGTQVLGRQLRESTFPAWTDARFFSAAGIPTIPGFGPGTLVAAHRPNESVAVEAVVKASRMLALGALRYLSGHRGDEEPLRARSESGGEGG